MSAARHVTVVGSGPSGVHFARKALDRGFRVTLLDVGHERPAAVEPQADFRQLKERLDDPQAYFLGEDLSGVVYPDDAGEYYGIPPSKGYVFRGVAPHRFEGRGFEPLFSFARGGLAEAWTAGAYAFGDDDLRAFPFDYAELAPYYAEVARAIGISGEADDLARFMPVHDDLAPPLRLDEASRRLYARYEKKRAALQRAGVWMGRSRIATLSADRGHRRGCQYLGRCLWGCPVGALYTPGLTLAELREHERFTYVDGVYVERFHYDDGARVRSVRIRRLGEVPGTGVVTEDLAVEALVLAAGCLGSSRIFLESIRDDAGDVAREGLMDNRQALMPFVQLGMIGQAHDPATYQYHQLNLSLEGETPEAYVHGQVTTLKAALVHPIVQGVPFDLRRSLGLFRALHAALGLVNVNLHDTRRAENQVALEDGPDGRRLALRYAPPVDEPERLRRILGRYRRALWKLGCIVPPGMTHVRPMGASVHYAGTLPMQADAQPRTLSPVGRSHDFSNLWVVDGAGLPFLPAKNPTLTLMVHATRVADRMG